ncbi:hypothetical protein ASPCADRAFT_139942, partial [Aspergillus carbonarius ITEM 5010]
MVAHSGSAIDSDRKCPHLRLRQERDRVGMEATPIKLFLEDTPRCADCSLLVQIIEAIKPGWIAANKDLALVELRFRNSEENNDLIVPQCTLHVQQSADQRNLDSPVHQAASFHFLQRVASVSYRGPYCHGQPAGSGRYTGRYVAESLQVMEDSGSPAAFERAQQWLSFCEENHEACKPPNLDFCPRRLVNVGSWDGSHEPFLYEPTTPVRYACLSYCWGKDLDQVLTTRTDNIRSHYEKIAMSTLPLALQDAITVCRNLKIPNLWVDSLCIIQDDIVAWLHDASTMYDVYLNSHLTITVMEPNSCKSRFLGKQRCGDPSWQQLLRPSILTTGKDTPPKEVLIRPRKFQPRSDEDRSSLDRRGWCLQESLLPNRRLCYDGNEMIWECVCRQFCECGHVVAPQVPRKTTPNYSNLGAFFKSHRLRGIPPSNDLSFLEWQQIKSSWRMNLPPHIIPFQRWRELVMDYSYRSLSKKHDRLRAISGLARMVWNNLRHEDDTPEQYLAGLWKGDLLSDLCWQVRPLEEVVESPETGAETPKEVGYHIPSWSWASVERPVTYRNALPLEGWKHKPSLVDQCIVENASCQNELPEDPMSAVTEGSLVLTGAFAPVKLGCHEHGHDEVRRILGLHSRKEMGAFVQSSTAHEVEVTLDRPERDRPRGIYYCFRLFSWLDTGIKKLGMETWFLVLTASTRQAGAFERIGIGCWDPWPDHDPCPIFKDAESATIEII